MSLFSIRRQMDDLMNQMMLSSPHLHTPHHHIHHSSLFDNDPFFTAPLLLIDNNTNNTTTNNNNTKQEVKDDANQDKNKSSALTTNNNNNNNSSLSPFTNRINNQWGLMKCDVHEEKDKFVVSAELPGVNKDQVKVSVDNGYLTISGDKREEKTDVKNDNNGREIRRSERRYGEFQRSFRLPETADTNNINAKFENGVLNLNIPKLEKIQPKVQQININ